MVLTVKDDLISRQAAIDAIVNLWADKPFGNPALVEIRECVKGLPTAQPDLSEYSDKLWKAAYERGKEFGYLQGKGDGIKFFTDELKKINAHLSDTIMIAYQKDISYWKERREDD